MRSSSPTLSSWTRAALAAAWWTGLRQLGFVVQGVDFGGRPIDQRYENRRCEMWMLMADWTREGGCLPDSQELAAELATPKFSYANARGKLELESKDDMRKRGMRSPDIADALALTFASPVAPRAARRRMAARCPPAWRRTSTRTAERHRMGTGTKKTEPGSLSKALNDDTEGFISRYFKDDADTAAKLRQGQVDFSGKSSVDDIDAFAKEYGLSDAARRRLHSAQGAESGRSALPAAPPQPPDLTDELLVKSRMAEASKTRSAQGSPRRSSSARRRWAPDGTAHQQHPATSALPRTPREAAAGAEQLAAHWRELSEYSTAAALEVPLQRAQRGREEARGHHQRHARRARRACWPPA